MNVCRFLQLATAHLLTTQPSIKISFFPLETCVPYAINLCIWVEGFFFLYNSAPNRTNDKKII